MIIHLVVDFIFYLAKLENMCHKGGKVWCFPWLISQFWPNSHHQPNPCGVGYDVFLPWCNGVCSPVICLSFRRSCGATVLSLSSCWEKQAAHVYQSSVPLSLSAIPLWCASRVWVKQTDRKKWVNQKWECVSVLCWLWFILYIEYIWLAVLHLEELLF